MKLNWREFNSISICINQWNARTTTTTTHANWHCVRGLYSWIQSKLMQMTGTIMWIQSNCIARMRHCSSRWTITHTRTAHTIQYSTYHVREHSVTIKRRVTWIDRNNADEWQQLSSFDKRKNWTQNGLPFLPSIFNAALKLPARSKRFP